jgi:hypothetical protein
MELAGASRSPTQGLFLKACWTHKARKAAQFTCSAACPIIPISSAHRDVIHKIGVTGRDVESRIANARLDATFLLAEVEVVATYTLFNINRSRLENLLHRFFAAVRLHLTIKNRFGIPVVPPEWFLAPLSAIDEVVQRIQDHSIIQFEYDRETASLRKAARAD